MNEEQLAKTYKLRRFWQDNSELITVVGATVGLTVLANALVTKRLLNNTRLEVTFVPMQNR